MGKVVEVLMVVLAVVLLYDLQCEVASCLFPDYCRIAQLVNGCFALLLHFYNGMLAPVRTSFNLRRRRE